MCKTNKKRYPDELTAKIKLVEIRASRELRNRTRRREQRVYRCPFCCGWHLTSSG